MQFQYLQIMHALPQHWKESINNFAGNLNNLYIQDHHLINCNTIYSLEKLNTKRLYHKQMLLKYVKPGCQNYHERKFDGYNFNWKLIYKLPRIVTYDAKIRIFQYKLSNNVLYLNKKRFYFGTIPQPKCSICNLYDETPQHLFLLMHVYTTFMELSSILYFRKNCITSFNSTECVIFGFTDVLD